MTTHRHRHRTPTGKHRYAVCFQIDGQANQGKWRETRVLAFDEGDARQRATNKLYGSLASWFFSGGKSFKGKVRRRSLNLHDYHDVTNEIICSVERVKP